MTQPFQKINNFIRPFVDELNAANEEDPAFLHRFRLVSGLGLAHATGSGVLSLGIRDVSQLIERVLALSEIAHRHPEAIDDNADELLAIIQDAFPGFTLEAK